MTKLQDAARAALEALLHGICAINKLGGAKEAVPLHEARDALSAALAADEAREPAAPDECPTCDGTGRVDDPSECPCCGKVGCRTVSCDACQGSGIVSPPAPAAQPAHAPAAHTRERHFALREAHGGDDEESFFAARPWIDSEAQREMFRAGHQRGFDAAEKVYARAPAAPAAQAEPHPDDQDVDTFAALLKAKLAKARAKGRSGWRDASWPAADINRQMHEHAAKGDPLDVAAYAMFLALRGEATTAPEQPAQGLADERAAFEAWVSTQAGHPFAGAYTTLMRKAWQARAAISAAPRVPQWQPIETAPSGALVVVFWIDREGQEHHDLDYLDDGCWQKWHDYAEHVEVIGGHGVSYTAPYTGWLPLPASAAPQPKEGA